MCLWFFLRLPPKSENALPLLTPQPRERFPQNWVPLHRPIITHSERYWMFIPAQAWWYSRDGARPAGLAPTLFTRTTSESATSQVQPRYHALLGNFHTLHTPDNFYACSRGRSSPGPRFFVLHKGVNLSIIMHIVKKKGVILSIIMHIVKL